ncbi:hypothetical protein Pelo_15634 [Pelomyxa schiedti]|nr:hypothetical protein Pelo_15634 [Pelomyxa schiedti]
MRAPPDVYSATFHNRLSTPVNVSIVYSTAMGREPIPVNVEVAPGAQHAFPQRTFDEGTCTYTYVISELKVLTIVKHAPFAGVSSPTKDFHFSLVNDGHPELIESKTP